MVYEIDRYRLFFKFFSSAHGGGRVVSASGSETSVSGSTPASAIIYDAYTSIKKKKFFFELKHFDLLGQNIIMPDKGILTRFA